ncbi:helix-turn-helix domain-containing protein [Paraflavitalea pollutisoli]|uniref:helix-turn-helix domain-containing protein n=1 Tax=Paraflavitalea pollutisoli TaxID=3034143 RepID=UPI0023EC03EE|nr:helix-turn-helix domain-containing protein [Paraflavitalea sp. H1-2-19X]
MHQHQEYEPPEALRDVIQCFWLDSRKSGAAGAEFEVLPDGFAEIIFHVGGDCSVVLPGGRQPLPSPFMMGLLDQPVRFYSTHQLTILAIRCFPWTVFDLLGLPAGKGGIHIFTHPIAGLQPILQQQLTSGDIDGALRLVIDYFLEIRAQVAMDSMLHKAGMALRQANGMLPVSEVAAAAHATVRTLERNFKQSSGHTVKDVSGLMRFEQVRNQLWRHPAMSLAGLAAELGYTDQSHLSREFKRYSGTTPAAFARKARQTKQTVSRDFVAFVQA